MKGLLKRLIPKKKELRCGVVVPAAGSASRMEGMDKILLPLGGIPVLIRSLQALEACPLVTEIVVATREDLLVPASRLCRDYGLTKVTKLVVGGATRTHSVLAGVRELSRQVDVIAIHDGARPFVSQEILETVIQQGGKSGAAAPAVPVKDTIKRARGGVVIETVERSELFAIQTPQVFEPALIRAALEQALTDQAVITDDCSAVERLGMSVVLTQGSDENIKVTTPSDLNLGLGILNGRGEFK